MPCRRVCESVRGDVCVLSLTLLLCGILCGADPVRGLKDVYVALGSPMSVACPGADGVQVEWRLNGSVFQRGPKLTLLNTTMKDQGLYSCYDLAGRLLHTLAVHPGYPPSRPEVRCWSHRYPLEVFCSWEGQTESLLPTHYLMSYRGKGGTKQCRPYQGSPPSLPGSEHPSPGLEPPSPGSQWFCVLTNMDQYHLYQINVTAVNPLGRSTRLLSFTMEDIVKPERPVNVHVVPWSSRRCSVEWAPPPSWPFLSIFPLKYKVKYQWEKVRTGPTESPPLGPYETSRVVLGGLTPGTTYVIQVCAMDLLDLGLCSDWSAPANITMPARQNRR